MSAWRGKDTREEPGVFGKRRVENGDKCVWRARLCVLRLRSAPSGGINRHTTVRSALRRRAAQSAPHAPDITPITFPYQRPDIPFVPRPKSCMVALKSERISSTFLHLSFSWILFRSPISSPPSSLHSSVLSLFSLPVFGGITSVRFSLFDTKFSSIIFRAISLQQLFFLSSHDCKYLTFHSSCMFFCIGGCNFAVGFVPTVFQHNVYKPRFSSNLIRAMQWGCIS